MLDFVIKNLNLILPILLVITLKLVSTHSFRSKTDYKAKIKKTLLPNQTHFICDSIDLIGGTTFQLYGDVVGGDIVPGATLHHAYGQFTVVEVYGSDESPDQPDPHVHDGDTNIAIVVDSPSFPYLELKNILKREHVIILSVTHSSHSQPSTKSLSSPSFNPQSNVRRHIGLLLGLIIISGGLYLSRHPQLIPSLFFAPLDKLASPTPSPSPTPFIYHEPTTEQKKYLLALGAIISSYNYENISTLASNMNPTTLRTLLKSSWGVADRDSILSVLNWLRDDGHSLEYDQAISFYVANHLDSCTAIANYAITQQLNYPDSCDNQTVKNMFVLLSDLSLKTGTHSLKAWDYGRLVNMSRWGYTIGWLSEQESWTYMILASRSLQKEYSSWREYGEQYLLGRTYWQMGNGGNGLMDQSYRNLLRPNASWSTIDWNTDLD